jgi:hypothetical protein
MTEGNYSNVGHRGPGYKDLGAMNPCDLSTYPFAELSVKYIVKSFALLGQHVFQTVAPTMQNF